MKWILGIFGFFCPRVLIVLLVIFGDYIGRAYHGVLWPLLGFFFAPFTTLAYALAMNEHGSLDGGYLAVFIIAILMDLGVIGRGAKQKRLKEAKSS